MTTEHDSNDSAIVDMRLVIKEKSYKKGTNWRSLSLDESTCLLASVDTEDDDEMALNEESPGDFFFAKDFTCRLYYVEPITHDERSFQVMEAFRDFRMQDPDELRAWFKNIPQGTHRLKVEYGQDEDDETYLEFVEVFLENGGV